MMRSRNFLFSFLDVLNLINLQDETSKLELLELPFFFLLRYGKEWKERWAHENVYKNILSQLPTILSQHAKPVDEEAFSTWPIFFKQFLEEGGIMEACPPTDQVDGITAHVLIEPDGGVRILSVVDQIHAESEYKSWGYTLPLTGRVPTGWFFWIVTLFFLNGFYSMKNFSIFQFGSLFRYFFVLEDFFSSLFYHSIVWFYQHIRTLCLAYS